MRLCGQAMEWASARKTFGRCAEDRSRVKTLLPRAGEGITVDGDIDELVSGATAESFARHVDKLKPTKGRSGNWNEREVVEIEEVSRRLIENQLGMCRIQAERTESFITIDRDEEVGEGSGSEFCRREDMYQTLSSGDVAEVMHMDEGLTGWVPMLTNWITCLVGLWSSMWKTKVRRSSCWKNSKTVGDCERSGTEEENGQGPQQAAILGTCATS